MKDVVKNQDRFEQEVRDDLLEHSHSIPPARRHLLTTFDMGLGLEPEGDPTDELFAVEYRFKEEYLKELDETNAIKSLEFPTVNTVLMARIIFQPNHFVKYLKERGKQGKITTIEKDEYLYIDFGTKNNSLIKIARTTANEAKLVELLLNPIGSLHSFENVLSMFKQKERSPIKISTTPSPMERYRMEQRIRSTIKEVQSKLKQAGFNNKIKFTVMPQHHKGIVFAKAR